MTFLSLILALGIVYWLGTAQFMHWDGWYRGLVLRLQRIPGVVANPIAGISLSLFIPCFALALIIIFVVQVFNSGWLILINLPVLLYCIGRSDFVAEVQTYIDIVQRGDTVAASRWVDEMRGNAARDPERAEVSDWKGLHTEALKVIAYRGFERTFAVLFWFFIAGALGALLYRLSVLYREINETDSQQAQLASRWLWLLELPSVRLMGVTWALVGNFDTTPLRENMLDMDKSSMEILNACLRGALGANADASINQKASKPSENTNPEALSEDSVDVIEDLTGAVITTQIEPAYSFALVKSSMPLYTRSLLFWVCAVAFATLFIA
jgi:AmpE protein